MLRRSGIDFAGTAIPASALAVALLLCSAMWAASVFVYEGTRAGQAEWPAVSLFWIATMLLTPSVCFALGFVLLNGCECARLTGLDICALVAGLLPVTLGSALAIITIKVWFWSSFEMAPVTLQAGAVLAVCLLLGISGNMIWRTIRAVRRLGSAKKFPLRG